jgi:SAM-dependent methyltransferase
MRLPPASMRFMNESDERFLATADELYSLLVTRGNLTPEATVLDIGCGYGRLLYGLVRGGWHGRYVGVDVLAKHVDWCSDNLGDGDRVTFEHANVRNDRYNRKGTLRPAELNLPVKDADVIALFSVFTHMWPDDVVSYLRLCRQALAPDGRVVATFFLDNWRLRRLERRGLPTYVLPHGRGPARWQSDDDPLHVIAMSERWVRRRARQVGLRLARPPEHGTWSGREGGPTFQDLVTLASR